MKMKTEGIGEVKEKGILDHMDEGTLYPHDTVRFELHRENLLGAVERLGSGKEDIGKFLRAYSNYLEAGKEPLGESGSYRSLACEDMFYTLEKCTDPVVKKTWEEVINKFPE